MTEMFNDAIRGKLSRRKMDISKKKPADPGELLARAQAALGELEAVLTELAAAEPVEENESAAGGA